MWILVKTIFYISVAYVMLEAGCEYRDCKSGHRWIGAFYAKTPYQKLFTLMQCQKDVGKEIGKLTYIGYAGVVLGSVSGMAALVAEIYIEITKAPGGIDGPLSIWAGFCGVWGVCCVILQGIDSLINLILEQVFGCRKVRRYRRRRRRRRR